MKLRQWAVVVGVAVPLLGMVFAPALEAQQPATPVVPTRPGANTAAPATFADLAERLLPAVVNISTTMTVRPERAPPGQQGQAQPPRRGPEAPQFPPGSPFEEFFRDFFDRGQGQGQGPRQQTPQRQQSLGSGFIIDASGYVVTNNHVIADADEIRVILHDNTQLIARVVGRDTRTDLALLKIEHNRPLATVAFGDSDRARIGDWVIAIGNPFGVGVTVTQGIISARARDINAGPYDDFLQTDASINRGNSGGPLFNLAGEVIGINTAIFSPTGASVGIGFAIPSVLARNVISSLRTHGRVRRGWLGVQIQTVTDEIAESLRLDRARGALIARVNENGPADQARIRSGDVVLRFDGREITDMRRLPRVVAETAVESEVPVVVWRNEREVTLSVRVGELPEDQVAAAPVPQQPTRPPSPVGTVETLGMTLAAITPELRQRFELGERARGVVVTQVADGSSAAQRGVRAGDVIVEIAQEEVQNPQQVIARVNQERQQPGRRSILVMIERQGEQRFIGLTLEPRG